MIVIRPYRESDVERVGKLIADTYGVFNLSDIPPEQRVAMLGPFANARSSEPSHRTAIAEAISPRRCQWSECARLP
jgi:hypothetical protein